MTEELYYLRFRVQPSANILFCLELDGSLSLVHLEQALNSLVRRHAALRTTIMPNKDISSIERQARLRSFETCPFGSPGLYLQAVVRDGKPCAMASVNTCWPIARETQELLLEDLLRPFDYSRSPLLRAKLLKIDSRKHLLVLVVAAVICDFWSLHIVHADIARLYDEAADPLLPRGGPPESQFYQFVRWQYEQAQRGYFDDDIAFWRERWRKCESARIQYRDFQFSRSNGLLGEPGTERLRVNPELSVRLRAFAVERRIEVRSVVLAAFCAWLAEATNKELVGLTMSMKNRVLTAHKNAVGWFSNMHFIIVDVPAGIAGAVLAARTHAVLLEAEAHQAVPPALLWSRIGHAPEHGDVGISFTFASDVGAPPVCTRDGLLIRTIPLPQIEGRRVPGGLSALGLDQDEGLLLAVNYAIERFSAENIRQMLNALQETLLRIVEHPQESISRKEVISAHG